MAAEGINISLAQVTATAQTIRGINESLATRLEEIKREMNQLSASWQSDASNTIVNKFNALAPRFEEYKQIIDSYATFLDNTVASYDAVETQLVNNANAFK